MKKLLIIFAIGLVFLLGQNVFANSSSQEENSGKPLHLWIPYDAEKPDDLDNLDKKYIFIEEQDLEEIKNSKNPKKDDSGDPPVSYQITSVNYIVNADKNILKIQGVYKINKLDDEWVLIPVISDKTGISSAVLGGNKAFIINDPYKLPNYREFKNFNKIKRNYNYLVLKKKGSYVLKLDFIEDIVNLPSQNTKSFSFSLPEVSITNIECNFNEKNLAVQVPEAVSLETKETPQGSKIIASFPPVEKIEVKWTPKSEMHAIKNLPPSVSAVTYSRIEMGRGSLKGTFNADVDIRRSSMSKFKFYIPEDIEIDTISVKDNELIDPYPEIKDNILPLELVSPVEGRVKFTISYRKNFENSSFMTKIPAITLVNNNIDRETGFVAAVETTNIESSIVKADKTKNYKEIDSRELQGNLRGIKASIALKYTKNKDNAAEIPYDITINVVKHKDVAVYEASLESINITSVLNHDGDMFSKAQLSVRNTGKQFLDIKLPLNSSVWSVYVNNKSVKPALKDENKGVYAVPLVKSISSDRRGKSFPVEIVYFTDKAASGFPLGVTSLKAMTTELVANTINWNVYVPEKTKFMPLTAFSNLLKDKKTRRRFNRNMLDSLSGGMNKEMLQQETKIEMTKDKNDIFYRESPKKAFINKRKPAQQRYKQTYRSKKVGDLPVYVNLPTIGQSFSFYQLSFEADKFPQITALQSSLIISNILTLLLLAALIYIIVKRHQAKAYKSVGFIASILIITAFLYKLIGLNLFWIVVLWGIITLFKKKIIKLPKMNSKNPLVIIGMIIGGLALLAILFFSFPEFILRLVVLLIGLGLFAASLFGLFKIGQFIFKKFAFKKKPKTEQTPDDDLKMEGNN